MRIHYINVDYEGGSMFHGTVGRIKINALNPAQWRIYMHWNSHIC